MRRLTLLALVLALLAAAPTSRTDNLVRQGNAALAKRDLAGALQIYERAEERTTDPGLVAFNKAIAFYQKADFAQAELHFRLALQDASGPRRAAVLYNLAGCLVQQAGDRDLRKLSEAVRHYEECLHADGLNDLLATQARHNRELAKTLWTLARTREEERKDKPPSNDDPPDKPPPRPDHGPSGPPELGTGQAKAGGDRTPAKKDPGQDPIGTDENPQASKGALNVIPDSDEPVSMTHEEAIRHLKQATLRVLLERSAHRQRTRKAPPGKVRDW